MAPYPNSDTPELEMEVAEELQAKFRLLLCLTFAVWVRVHECG